MHRSTGISSDLLGQNICHIMGPLKTSGDPQQPLDDDCMLKPFMDDAPDHQIHNASFIVEHDENDVLGRARTLVQNQQPCPGDTGYLRLIWPIVQ